jgi:pyrimidine-nucleoside phosphorylase
MNLIDIIETKKLGKQLSPEQIAFFANQAASSKSLDYQLAARLMAIRLNGMSIEETTALTIAMAKTGDILSPDVDGVAVDKHSTGGVGDTTTLILVPLVAACGGRVVKMSGRGLGHTGGTIDKMESIPGMRVELSEEEMMDNVRRIGCCVVGQTGDLVPADKRLYALRDVTSTVDSIPLIASSIMSKKIAGGAEAIVLDVKLGAGAMMKTLDDCVELAQTMVGIGAGIGREVVAFITGMEEPLGSHVGNALEVKDAIDVLAGRTEGPLLEVSLRLGEQMLILSGLAKDEEDAHHQLVSALNEGRGLKKFKEMIAAQGGNPAVCDNISLLPQAKYTKEVLCPVDGYILSVDAQAIGEAARQLGAGRTRKDDILDLSVGLVMHRRIGDRVRKGDPLATIYHNDEQKAASAQSSLLDAVKIGKEQPPKAKLIYGRITKNNTEIYP